MYDVIVIGGGPAGLAAALGAHDEGAGHVLIIERAEELGGILNQCIHNGFGLHTFGEELTGPEYAQRYIDRVKATNIEVRLDTMVLEVLQINGDVTDGAGLLHEVHMVSRKYGYVIEKARSVILAMGCRERPRGGVVIPGTRPAGVFTAGTAQKYVNVDGYMPGRRVVILGSGDIGLIMARRMTLEGAKVLAVVEIMPYSGGLSRNIVQCLNDYDIPLYLSHSVTEIRGEKRVEQVVVSRVDKFRNPIPGTEMVFDCDTLLLSCGLIPENELSNQMGLELDPRSKGAYVYENMEASIPGIFVCGNVAHVHDLVDFVSAESTTAGAAAAEYAKGGRSAVEAGRTAGPAAGFNPAATYEPAAGHATCASTAADCPTDFIAISPGWGLSYTLPQRVRPERVSEAVTISFRVKSIFKKAYIIISSGSKEIARIKRLHMAPGEMQKIQITKEQLLQAEFENDGLTLAERKLIRISIEEIMEVAE